MARKKDLGGLAALAGLAYLASRGKGEKGDKGDKGVDLGTSNAGYDDTMASKDLGEIRDDDGTLSKTRINTETGERYTLDNDMAAPARPAASRPAASRPAATASKSKAIDLGTSNAGYGDATTATEAPVDVTKLSLAERAKLSRERARSDGTKTDSRSVNERMRDTFGMKKGGSVKGWGMARGARKAKTY